MRAIRLGFAMGLMVLFSATGCCRFCDRWCGSRNYDCPPQCYYQAPACVPNNQCYIQNPCVPSACAPPPAAYGNQDYRP